MSVVGHIVFYVYKTLSTSVKSGVHLHEIFTHAMVFTEALKHTVFNFSILFFITIIISIMTMATDESFLITHIFINCGI